VIGRKTQKRLLAIGRSVFRPVGQIEQEPVPGGLQQLGAVDSSERGLQRLAKVAILLKIRLTVF